MENDCKNKGGVMKAWIKDCLDDLIKVQKDCLSNEYMRGMCNGLICARASLLGEEPKYVRKETPRKNSGTVIEEG